MNEAQREHMRELDRTTQDLIIHHRCFFGGARGFTTEDRTLRVEWDRQKFLGGGIWLDAFIVHINEQTTKVKTIDEAWDLFYPAFCAKHNIEPIKGD